MPSSAGNNAFGGTFMSGDGHRLWVAQSSGRPLLWSIDIGGGARTTVYDAPDGYDGEVEPLHVAGDHVFFSAATWQPQPFDPPYNPVTRTWNSVSTSGGPVMATPETTLKVEGFDWTGARAFAIGVSNTLPVVAVSLADGSTNAFASPDIAGFELAWLVVTGGFVHLTLQDPKPGSADLRDMRIDVTTGAVHDTVPFVGSVAGPTDACGLVWNGAGYGVACLSDSASAPRVIVSSVPVSTALGGESDVLYVDDSWVYVAVAGETPHLSRFSLDDAHEEKLIDGVTTLAATGSGACVFAMTWTPSSTTLWRLPR